MLKIRCTDVRNPTTENSYSTEYQKAKFHSPYLLNEERNRVQYNSVNEIPSDLVIQTKSNTASVSDSVFSERKEENAEIVEDAPAEEPAPAPVPTCTHTGDSPRATTHSRNKEVNMQELWETSQCI